MSIAYYNVAILEDNKCNRDIIEKLIEYFGYTSKTYSNGFEFINDYPNNDFDVILTDIHMPNINGLETMKKISELYIEIPPIIVMTADIIENLEQLCINYGIVDIIKKPINIYELKKILLKYINIDVNVKNNKIKGKFCKSTWL